MADVTLSAKDPSEARADALVIAVGVGDDGPQILTDSLPAGVRRRIAAALDPLGVTGSADEVVRIPSGIVQAPFAAPIIVTSGVGRPGTPSGTAPPGTPSRRGRAKVSPEALRRAAGAAVRSLTGTATVAIAFPVPDDAALLATCEGALLGAYAFDRYRSQGDQKTTTKAANRRLPVRSVVVLTPQARTATGRAIAKQSAVVAEAVNGCRDLVNTAPADLYPASFAAIAEELGASHGVKVTVWDERKLARGGYGGLIGVGQGSARPPRLVRVEHAPPGAVAHLAFVGKGITFDSGGISLKPPAGMDQMKSDMSGAGAVLWAVLAIAKLDLPVRVTGWLALAENMPSGTAQRPSDVLTVRNGTTVEVLNTDAEGRLVLADALVDACAEHPDLVVDVATLTGAQRVALGTRVSALMSNNEALRARVHSVAHDAGEQFWPLPLPTELRSTLDSQVADIANIGDGQAGTLVAGLFLAEFIGTRKDSDERIPWAHLDIATPALNTASAHGYTPVGGTGVAVRTLIALAQDAATKGTAT